MITSVFEPVVTLKCKAYNDKEDIFISYMYYKK